jgi:hypothetical protein
MNYGLNSTESFSLPEINASADWQAVAFFAVFAVVFLIIILIVLKIMRNYFVRNQYLTQTVFMVRLPKEKPGEENKEVTVQGLREEIAVGESIFNSIGGARAQRGLKAWLFGREDHFSFEIVASDKKIFFYVVAPAVSARYIEQQIHAHYPDALVEEVPDYNIFHPDAKVNTCVLKTKKSFIFPLRTYNKMEIDPMNSIVNVMSKLEKDESMVVQLVVRSAKAVWHSKISAVVREVNRGKGLGEALGGGTSKNILSFLRSVAQEAKPKGEREKTEAKEPKKLSAMEEEMLKNFEEKNSKAGLDVNLRIVASTKNISNGKAYLNNMVNAFAEFNYYEYGNIFKQKIIKFNGGLIHDFIYRRFDQGLSFLLNTEELAGIFHFPLKHLETPNIAWLTARQASAPPNAPTEGIVLGKNVYRGVEKEIRIKRPDRRRHMYIIGKSGTGKSQFIASLAIQDILNGEGVCIMDPHGDLIEDILRRIPPERAEDVFYFRRPTLNGRWA